MEERKARVESDDEIVVKHQQSAASPPVAAVLTADNNKGVLPDDHIRQDLKNTYGQVCLTCKYMYMLPCASSSLCLQVPYIYSL